MAGLKELKDEFKLVLSGRTMDAIIPPVVYGISNLIWGLAPAAVLAVGIALVLGVLRAIKKQKSVYAFIGLSGVLFATAYALFTRRAENYFLPGILSNGALLVACLLSLVFGKPVAAYTSHLTRAWPIDWYWRRDVKPAYTEVTAMWLVLIGIRMIVSVIMYVEGSIAGLTLVRFASGWPLTLIVLAVSYIYGIWRLKNLNGPSVEEFLSGSKPPYHGQNKGF